MFDQGSWDINLDRREFMDFGALSQDMGLNTLAKPQGMVQTCCLAGS